ncbi:MAG TPA: signal peptidase I [Phycisphaerae bacterium]|nr:signal peptidase I [Phycisphaerae bacterium]
MKANTQQDLQETHRRRKKRESLLETLESIVVAFVLAFVFRAFVVEAFVIPTGSMAPTLNGAHLEFECPDCGYEFAMGAENRRVGPPLCPNCFLPQPLSRRGVPLYSGDRLLVLKFLYDFEQPRRWDVMVFRNPNQPTENYIKRLVALPGETLELVRGDVTINGRIVQKADKVQEALWMLVHDTRYRPTRSEWTPRWTYDLGWQAEGTGFRMKQTNGKVAWLTYKHRDPRGNRSPILDFYAYNSGSNGPCLGSNVCADLGLRGEIAAEDAASVVLVELWAYKDRFRFELTAEGSERPTRILKNGQLVAEAPGGVLPVGRAVEFLAANVDHKLMLLVDGRRIAEPVGGSVAPQGDPLCEPTPTTEEERYQIAHQVGKTSGVRLGARGGPVAVGYLRLDRDVYYTSHDVGGRRLDPGHAIEGRPLTLKADEFFVLGDNSPKSSDSRLWNLPRPVAPRRNLVGKAIFVYWPSAGRRHGIPLAPDPTGWRFVH